MSAFPDSETSLPIVRPAGLSQVQFALLACALAVLGLSTIWFTMLSLWTLWTTDPLKSIGMVIPLVSLVLVLRAWRGLGWQAQGTWWGLALVLVTMLVVRIQQQSILILVISPRWSTALPPPSLMLFAYGSGVVLLLGGVRLYRAALFPILLLWFANPIPSRFTLLVDLPLQHASAHIARAFAMHLGHSLTPDHLRLMFTPDFGMFIAPGCNGIRGSLTMGFIALIAGYIYGFRWYANAVVVTGAILLGYVFNLARLCLLVLYYIVALHFPWLQDKAENGDYVIGGVLFLVATLLLFAVVHRLRDAKGPHGLERGTAGADNPSEHRISRGQFARLAAMGAIVVFACVGVARAISASNPFVARVADPSAVQFPHRVGNYNLVRTWNEGPSAGSIVYVWAQYVPAEGGTPIAIGVSPVPDWHDPVICHFVRGEDPLWHGQLTTATAAVVPVGFSSALYTDGVTRWLEASTLCRGGECGEFTTKRNHFGFVYTHPEPGALLNQSGQSAIRVLLHVETLDLTVPVDTSRQQLTQDLRFFLASTRLDDLTRPYSR
jgi:exosortase J